MKTKQTIPVMIALVAIMSVVFSPMAQAVVSDRLSADTTGRAQVHFEGTTHGWAIIGGQAHVAEIEIEGNAVRADNGVWKVTSEAEITAADKHAKVDLKGKAANGRIGLHGTGTLDSGESFRIVLRGHYTPVFDEQGSFVMAFTTAKIHSAENNLRIPLMQSGIVKVEAVDPTTVDYETFVKEFTRK